MLIMLVVVRGKLYIYTTNIQSWLVTWTLSIDGRPILSLWFAVVAVDVVVGFLQDGKAQFLWFLFLSLVVKKFSICFYCCKSLGIFLLVMVHWSACCEVVRRFTCFYTLLKILNSFPRSQERENSYFCTYK